MKTDIGIDIIGAIFSIIAILPIVMLIVNKKKREKKEIFKKTVGQVYDVINLFHDNKKSKKE